MASVIIESTNTISGLLGPYRNPGAPVNGTSAVETVTITGTPTGGTFTLSFMGATTTALAYNAAASDVQAALVALSTIGAGGVTCTGGALPGTAVTVTFAGNLAAQNVPLLGASGANLTGGTTPAVVIAYTTPGVDGTHLRALKGALLQDTTNGITYENKGVPLAPNWTAIGA